jgi:hypothetical protein
MPANVGDRNAPRPRGGLLEHRARGGAGHAHRLVEVPDRTGAVGVLRAVLLVANGLDDLHARPVGVEFVGHDQRQRRPRARAHLRPVRDDLHEAVGQDGEIDARLPGPLRQRVLREDRQRHEPRAEHERAGRRGAAEKGSTREDAAHARLPAACASLIAARMRWYVPQRHRMPSMYDSIWASVALGREVSSAAACMIWPLWQ